MTYLRNLNEYHFKLKFDWFLQLGQFETKTIFLGKDQIILVPGRGHFGRFLKFSDFSLWNNKNKSCLNDMKFWEVSGNPKTSKFWKLQLSI